MTFYPLCPSDISPSTKGRGSIIFDIAKSYAAAKVNEYCRK